MGATRGAGKQCSNGFGGARADLRSGSASRARQGRTKRFFLSNSWFGGPDRPIPPIGPGLG